MATYFYEENKHGIGPDRNKIEPTSVPNFLFQFEPMIRNPDDKELKYFQPFWSGGVDNTGWKKVQYDPMVIFLIGNRPFVVPTSLAWTSNRRSDRYKLLGTCCQQLVTC